MTSPTRLVLASALLLSACHTAHMQVDPALSDDRMSVSHTKRFGRGDLVFGEFTAHGIDRGWTHSSTTRVGGMEESHAHQRYAFALRAGADDAGRVSCESVHAGNAIDFGTLRIDRGRDGLGCSIDDADGRPRGELVLLDGERAMASGRIVVDDVAIDLVPERHAEGARVEAFAPLGFELMVDGAPVGAVQTINGGAVWIDGTAPAPLREAAALAAATVLLYQAP
jgi:hypothetical protein